MRRGFVTSTMARSMLTVTRAASLPPTSSSHSLNLNLNLASIDFSQVAKATRAAAVLEDDMKHTAMRGVASELDSLQRRLAAKVKDNQSSDASTHSAATGKSTMTTASPKNVERLGASLLSVPPSSSTTTANHTNQPRRQSTKERLQDCIMSGNYSKAVRLFHNALSVSRAAMEVADPKSAHDDGDASSTTGASPRFLEDPSLAAVGIGRWSGNNIRLLIESLIAAEASEEFTSTWSLIKQCRIPQHRFDAYIVNGLLQTTIRGHQRNSNFATESIVRHTKEEKKESLQAWKTVKRNFALDLGTFAEEKGFVLRESAQRALGAAREAERRISGGDGMTNPSSESSSAAEGGGSFTIEDVNNMLSQTTSYENLKQIMEKVDALQLPYNEATYVMLIKQLKRFGLDGNGVRESPAGKSEEKAPSDSAQVPSSSKAHEDRRAAFENPTHLPEVLKLFALYQSQFSGRHPSPSLVNAVLEFLKHRTSHDAKVYEVVGTLVSSSSPVRLDSVAGPVAGQQPTPSSSSSSETMTTTRSLPASIPLVWGSRPNTKTFEVLIRHAMHMNRPKECWFWFDEMVRCGVRGTGVAYHTMIDLAGMGHGRVRGSESTDILDVYQIMKDSKMDVANVDTTVTLINAWSSKHQAGVKRRRQ